MEKNKKKAYWTGKKRVDMLGSKNPAKRKEVREKISTSLLGKTPTEETRRKMRESHLGKKLSKETRVKMSLSSKKGKENNLWRGGKTKRVRAIRVSGEYSLWRSAVLKKDKWTCQKYGTKSVNLQVHHILNFSKYPELRFDINNGITLSTRAHKEFHKKYGTYNNTPEQLREFLNK